MLGGMREAVGPGAAEPGVGRPRVQGRAGLGNQFLTGPGGPWEMTRLEGWVRDPVQGPELGSQQLEGFLWLGAGLGCSGRSHFGLIGCSTFVQPLGSGELVHGLGLAQGGGVGEAKGGCVIVWWEHISMLKVFMLWCMHDV